MANAYINVYMNNPTQDKTDGTLVSSDGAQTSPIAATLDASKAESKIIKLAIRCEAGYTTDTDGAKIDFTGTTAGKWLVAYSAGNTADAQNVVFWAKATSSTDENPQNDISVKLRVSAKIVAL